VATYSRYCALCWIRGADTFVSETGQFIIHAYPTPQFQDRSSLTNSAIVELEPQFLAVTAERTKRVLLQELAQDDAYRGKVHLIILDRVPPDYPITLVSRVYSDGFEYQMGIPRQIENVKLIKGLIQAMLQEYANRRSHRSSELPAWLVEGMTREVLSSVTPIFIANKQPVTIEIRGYDRLNRARTFFSTNSGLTINELSFPDFSDAVQMKRFQNGAHLFVHELLRQPGGPQVMSRFIQALPFSFNWQKAFYDVYRSQFHSPLQLEKWWALVWADFNSKRQQEKWSLGLSLEKLQGMLMTSLEHRVQTNSIPQRREANLQELLSETGFSLQKAVLEQKLQQLYFLSFNLSPEASALAEGYQEVIKSYLDQKTGSEYRPGLRIEPETRDEYVIKNTVKELNRLDQLMADLRSGKIAPAARTARNSRQARR